MAAYSLKDISIAILNWNGLEWIQKMLPNVLKNAAPAKVVVIDNGSTDGSVAFLKKNYAEQIEVIRLEKNYGFAEGYNRGIAQIKSPFVVLLNSDVETSPNWLHHLFDQYLKNSNCGAIQPSIMNLPQKNRYDYAGAAGGFLDKWGIPYCRGRILASIENEYYHTDVSVDWTSGACMLIAKADFLLAGEFDAKFFAHMEEIDLCARLKRMGKTLIATPKSKVYHFGGGTLSAQSTFKTYLNHRNNLLFIAKNLKLSAAIFILFIRLCLDGLIFFYYLFQKKYRHSLAILKAHFGFYYLLVSHYFWKKNGSPKLSSLTAFPLKKNLLFQYFFRGKKKYRDLL